MQHCHAGLQSLLLIPLVPLLMTLKYTWRSFQPKLSFPRPFQLSFSYPWHAFASHGLPAIAELLVSLRYSNIICAFIMFCLLRFCRQLFALLYGSNLCVLRFLKSPTDHWCPASRAECSQNRGPWYQLKSVVGRDLSFERISCFQSNGLFAFITDDTGVLKI